MREGRRKDEGEDWVSEIDENGGHRQEETEVSTASCKYSFLRGLGEP
jgi:hypothetical protein